MSRDVFTIVSGGQTGADRGGLEAAIALGIAHGGWCPQGRRAEDGVIPARYQLRESDSPSYGERTRRNVVDSDATVLFSRGAPAGGSELTAAIARELGKPLLELDTRFVVTQPQEAAHRLRSWLAQHAVATLNVAGSRESEAPGIQALVSKFLSAALGRREYEIVDEAAAVVSDSADHLWSTPRVNADDTRPSEEAAIEVPYHSLQPETLRAVVEEFVTREGTDYGPGEWSLDDKAAGVIRQLERGEAKLIFEPKSQSVNIVVNPRPARGRLRPS